MDVLKYIYDNKRYFMKVIRKRAKNQYHTEEIFQEFVIRAYTYHRPKMTKQFLAQMADWEALAYLAPKIRVLPVKYADPWELEVPFVDNLPKVVEYERKLAIARSAIAKLRPKQRKVMEALIEWNGEDKEVWQALKIKQGAGESLKKQGIKNLNRWVRSKNEQA